MQSSTNEFTQSRSGNHSNETPATNNKHYGFGDGEYSSSTREQFSGGDPTAGVNWKSDVPRDTTSSGYAPDEMTADTRDANTTAHRGADVGFAQPTSSDTGAPRHSNYQNGSSHQPSAVDKMRGTAEVMAGKVLKKPMLVEKGQERKTGEDVRY